MNILNYNNKTYRAPASWKECTPDQVINLIFFSRIPKKDITDAVYEMAVQVLFSIPIKAWETWQMTNLEWVMVKEHVEWVFTAPQQRPFESFVHQDVTYFLPEENFANTTSLELSVAFMAWMEFVDKEDPDLTALDRLIATQCRPARPDLESFRSSEQWNGDDREPFNESRMIKRSLALNSLSVELKAVLLSYFEIQAKIFLENYEMLFGKDGNPRYDDGRGWIMLLKNVAKEGHFGNFDQVGQQYAHLVFAAILDDQITAEEIRENQQNDGN